MMTTMMTSFSLYFISMDLKICVTEFNEFVIGNRSSFDNRSGKTKISS